MTESRIPKWAIPNTFGSSILNDIEKETLLQGINTALRLLEVGGGPLNHVAGCYAETIDLENRRRVGFAGKIKLDDRPVCLLCRGEGNLTNMPIK